MADVSAVVMVHRASSCVAAISAVIVFAGFMVFGITRIALYGLAALIIVFGSIAYATSPYVPAAPPSNAT